MKAPGIREESTMPSGRENPEFKRKRGRSNAKIGSSKKRQKEQQASQRKKAGRKK